MSRLMKPINLREMAEGGIEFQIDADNIHEQESSSDEETSADLQKKMLQHANNECIGIFDEDTYEEGEPFERIAKKMFDLLPNGKIKKRIIREGDGEKPQEYASVKIHYNAYLEYEEQPYDSTYVRNKPYKFVINGGKILSGLNFSVQSMKLYEKAQFLIDPEYAYGKNLCIGKIPSSATVLFEVELIDVVNSGAAVTYEKLPEEEQKTFTEVYKYSMALCEKGKKAFVEHDLKNSIKDYNSAVAKLERVCLGNKDEVEKHRELSLKLYSNLLVCYTRIREPKKGCYNAKKIYDLTENGELMKIPTKVFFNHGKCLRILCEYEKAKEFLERARKLEPKNADIANELLNLEKDKIDHKKEQMKFAQALVGK